MEIVLITIESNQKEPMIQIDHFKAKLQSPKLRNFLLQYLITDRLTQDFYNKGYSLLEVNDFLNYITMDSLEKEEKAEGEVIQKGQYKRAYQKNWITGNFKANWEVDCWGRL